MSNNAPRSLLEQIVRQFVQNHRRQPEAVIVTPEALAVLAIKKAAPKQVGSVQVLCRDIDPNEVTVGDDASMVGVIVTVSAKLDDASLRGCSLKSRLQPHAP